MVRLPVLLRVLSSLGLLIGLFIWLDPSAVATQVTAFSWPWLLAGLTLSVVQVLLCAWRWRLTAGLIGVPLRMRYAVAEYYLAQLINQVLPGGVLGDAGRALRHAQQVASSGQAWRSVVIERASGQLAVALLSVLVLAFAPVWAEVPGRHLPLWGLGIAALGILLIRRGELPERARYLPAWCVVLWQDTRRALFSPAIWLAQLATSVLIVVSYALMMLCAARAIGVDLSGGLVLALTPPLLLAMLVPFSIAGWGLREGAAATLWAWVGLPPEQGVAVSLSYGSLVLVSTLPGLWVALRRRGQAAPPGSGGRQTDIKEGIVTAAETPGCRTQRRCQAIDRCHLQAGPSGADQQGSHKQVKTVGAAGFDKPRHGDATALDQHPPIPQAVQGADYIGWRKLTAGIGIQRHLRDPVVKSCAKQPAVYLAPHQVQGRRHPVLKQIKITRKPAVRIKDNPSRVPALHVPDGQAWVVGKGGAYPDHHGIDQGTQAVKVNQALLTVDIVGVAGMGGNSPVKALPKLGNHQALAAGQRGQAVKQLRCLCAYPGRALPVIWREPAQRRRWQLAIMQAKQPLPGPCQINVLLMRPPWSDGHAPTSVDRLIHDAGTLDVTQPHPIF